MITQAELATIMPLAGRRVKIYYEALRAAMIEFEIDTPLRVAAFLAQVAHESGELRYVRELDPGHAYDVGEKATQLGNTPEDDGDGEYHRGTGLIQLTGKHNQFECADHFGVPHDQIVTWLQTPAGACRSAAWFWQIHGLNQLADGEDFKLITKRINGGYTHYKERVAYYERAKEVLG